MNLLKAQLAYYEEQLKLIESKREEYKRNYAIKLEERLKDKGITKGTVIDVKGHTCGPFHHLEVEGNTFPVIRVYTNMYTSQLRISKKLECSIAIDLNEINKTL